MTANLKELDARTQELVQHASEGQDVIFIQDNKPVARIVRISERSPAADGPPAMPSYHMGFKGKLPSRAEFADEMFDRE